MKISSLLIAFAFASVLYGELPPTGQTSCPFGHIALSWQKVDFLCVTGPEKVQLCSTCGFAYDPWLQRWECRTGSPGLVSGLLPDFPALILNFPLSQENKDQEGVSYSQARSASSKLVDACFYWSSADFGSTIARIRSYLGSVGLVPEEVSRPYVGRVYSYFFARSGDRFLRVEVMLETNRRIAVDARLLAPSEIEHDYLLREALKVKNEPNK